MYCCDTEPRRTESVALPTGTSLRIGEAIRLAVALLLTGQSMLLGLAVNISPPEPETLCLLQGLVLTATLVVTGLLGWPLARSAWGELRRLRLTLEALFLTGIVGATAASLQSFLSGRGPIYFEVVSVLLVVYTLGKRAAARSRADARAAVWAWSQRLARCRLVGVAGRPREIEVTRVAPGDVVTVAPGEMITVDGELVCGEGFIQDTCVSGVPFARACRPGDRVLAGSVSLDGALHVRALSPGTGRQVDALLKAVERVCQETAPAQARADRLARFLFPVVVTIALATFGYWTWREDCSTGLFNAMSVLLVACPCALGLATPLALWSALGRLAERGLVARRADFVERLAGVDQVIFDKTGTLTEDACGLIGLATPGGATERTRLRSWIAAVQAASDHPVARAFAGLTGENEPPSVQLRSLRHVTGLGVEAVIEASAGRTHTLRVGRPEWFGPVQRPEAVALARQLPVASGLRVDVELDGCLAGVALVADRLRPSAAGAIRSLQEMGLEVTVMTGDSKGREVEAVVASVRTGLLPADKLQAVEALNQQGARLLFVGDGMNDAGALAAAHAGIALSSGNGLAAASAMAILQHGDLSVLPWAIAVCRRATTVVRFNLIWAVAYNLMGISLAALGLLHPVAAAVIMVLSSLGVVWCASRIGGTDGSCTCAPGPRSRDAGSGTRRGRLMSVGHGAAFGLQGIFLALLARLWLPTALVFLGVFALTGWGVAWVRGRRRQSLHWLDMSLGMLTVGNLGMVLGWWVDTAFGLHAAPASCPCQGLGPSFTALSLLDHAGMFAGMLIAGSAAMAGGGQRRGSGDWSCRVATFGGGNLGMAAGMIGGGCLAAPMAGPEGLWLILPADAGMTVGMLLGMFAGHAVASGLIRLLSCLDKPSVPAAQD